MFFRPKGQNCLDQNTPKALAQDLYKEVFIRPEGIHTYIHTEIHSCSSLVICKSSAYKEVFAPSIEPQVFRQIKNICGEKNKGITYLFKRFYKDCNLRINSNTNIIVCLLFFFSCLLYFRIETLDAYKLARPVGQSLPLISSLQENQSSKTPR